MYARCYARVSTDEQVDGFSLAAQKERLEAFCVSQGWTCVGHYVDEGYSGATMNRPALTRLLADANENDVILVYKLDRLTRSSRDLETLLGLSEERKIYLRTATEQIDTSTASGRLFLRLLIQFAQFERETIVERSVLGKKQKAKVGEWSGAVAPFGYTRVATSEMRKSKPVYTLDVDNEKAPIVRMIYDTYLEGNGTRKVAERLNELGIKTSSGRRWSSNAVKTILTNPVYCGDVAYGFHVRGRGSFSRYPGKHPAIIDKAIFDQAQAALASRQKSAPRQVTGIYPLSGIARCGVCGGSLSGYRNTNQETKISGKSYRNYVCRNWRHGKGCGNPPLRRISAEIVERSFIEQLSFLTNDDFERTYRKYVDDLREVRESVKVDVDALTAELEECRFAIKQWDTKFEKGHISEEEHEEKTSAHRARIREIRDALERAEREQAEESAVEDVRSTIVDFTLSWYSMTDTQRTQAVRYLVEFIPLDVRVYPDRRVDVRLAAHRPVAVEAKLSPVDAQTSEATPAIPTQES